MFYKILTIILILLVFISPCFGSRGNDFETSSAGAGIGSAYSGLCTDNTAMQYNLGSLAWIKHYEINFSHTIGILGTSYDSMTYVQKFGLGGIGIHVKMMHFLFAGADTQKIIKDGAIVDGQTLDMYNINVMIGYGFMLFDQVGLGIGGKFINHKVSDYSAQTFAGDVGLYYSTKIMKVKRKRQSKRGSIRKRVDDFRVGLSIQNIGGSLSYDEEGESEGDELPLTLRFGIGFIPYDFLTVGYEFKVITDKQFNMNDDSMNTGLGVQLSQRFARDLLRLMLRGGYSVDIQRGLGSGDLTFGGGVEVNYNAMVYRLDYTMKMQENSDLLGNSHYISFTMGESPTLFKWILREMIPSPDDIVNYNDYYTVRTIDKDRKKKEEMKEKVYKVLLKDIKTSDRLLIDSGIVDKFEGAMFVKTKDRKILNVVKEKSDLVVSGNLEQDAEILKRS